MLTYFANAESVKVVLWISQPSWREGYDGGYVC